MKTEFVFSKMGGEKKIAVPRIAKLFGISVQAVYRWGEDVPKLRGYQLMEKFPRKFPKNKKQGEK